MTGDRDLERRLTELYTDETRFRAPDRILGTVLARADITRQQGPLRWVRNRFGGVAAAGRIAFAVLLVIAVTAVALGVLYSTWSDVGQRPNPSPSPSPRLNEEGSGNFLVPFTYVLPEGVAFDYGTRNGTYFEIRVPAAAEAGHPAGVIVQAIGGGRVDPCDPESPYLPIDPGPQAVIDYLRTVPDVTVTDESPATVGEVPARQANVTAATETPTCEEIHTWVEPTAAFTDIPRQIIVRIIAIDVGEHVTFTVFGESSNLGWTDMADELIDSFRFGTPDTEELDQIRAGLPTPRPRSPGPS